MRSHTGFRFRGAEHIANGSAAAHARGRTPRSPCSHPVRCTFTRSIRTIHVVTAELVILLVVVVTALAFDFTNGFHDTGNAMATSIATGALKPKVAVTLSAILNLVGAFLSVEVAATVAKGVVNLGAVSGQDLLLIVFAGLVGGIIWNLATWLLGLPSSSSHALFGIK